MKIRQRRFFDQPICSYKVLVHFSGKPDHDVRADARIRNTGTYARDEFGIVLRCIRPVHRAKNAR